LEELPALRRDRITGVRIAQPLHRLLCRRVRSLGFIEQYLVSKIQLPIRCQSRRREIGRSDNRQNRPEAIEQHLLAWPIRVEEPGLGVQKSFVVEMNAY